MSQPERLCDGALPSWTDEQRVMSERRIQGDISVFDFADAGIYSIYTT